MPVHMHAEQSIVSLIENLISTDCNSETRGWSGHILSGLQIREHTRKLFSYFSIKIYVVGTQKSRLNETVLLSTQNTCLIDG